MQTQRESFLLLKRLAYVHQQLGLVRRRENVIGTGVRWVKTSAQKTISIVVGKFSVKNITPDSGFLSQLHRPQKIVSMFSPTLLCMASYDCGGCVI